MLPGIGLTAFYTSDSDTIGATATGHSAVGFAKLFAGKTIDD